MGKTKTLTEEQYNILQLNSKKYHALMAAGVDNWEGYDQAMDSLARETLKFVKPAVSVHFILDNSGSMSMIQDATISGFNEYIQTLKDDKENFYNLRLTKFGHEIESGEMVYIDKVKNLDKVSYPANGHSTRLYDAVCQTLKDVENDKEKNLVVIMTDGQENASKEYSSEDFKALVKKLEDKGNWTFTYLGANQDSYAVAQSFGIKTGNISNYHATDKGMGSAMRNAAMGATFVAQSANMSVADMYTPEQKKEMEETK